MKKILAMTLAVAFLLGMTAFPVFAEGVTLSEAPMLTARVEAGELPPLEERLPAETKLPNEILPEYLDYECGSYGGTMRFITSIVNWDADVFVGCNEGLLNMSSTASDVITPNIVAGFDANEDNTEFIITLREGLKWSDGVPVTMEDFEFAINDFVFNTELTPVVAAYLRDGGVQEGEPFKFEVIDDLHFKMSFNAPYGGLAVHLSIAGWKGYTDLLKPAHFLKKFHKDYAEEIHGSLEAYYEFLQPYGTCMGYDDVTAELVWTNVFHQLDMTNWELTDPNDALTSVYFAAAGQTEDFPVLYAWRMISSEGGITTFERNPYYHKVDANGQQLPYVDYLTSKLVENMEMVQMAYISGEADFGRESATIDNISTYVENAEKAGITPYVTTMHNNPTDVSLNVNYKEEAWQEVITDVRFRQALAHAIDAEEILDVVYKGFGEVNPYYPCDNDIELANSLLDEMGMVDIDGDGYRETPSGKKLSWSIYNNNEANDIIPVSELLVEYWAEIGLKADVKTVESTLRATMEAGNEIPCRVAWVHTTQLWHYLDWFQWSWCPLWDNWYNTDGAGGEEPPAEVKEFLHNIDSLMTVSPVDAVNEVLPKLVEFMSENLYLIEPLINVDQCVVINSKIGNVPTGGVGISWNFSIEQFFYRD
ncbi:MAG: ABC transporter substrate-binding protein [Christensenellales bacterium]|jgi:peptide/nickel transport system substrate-binding protein